MADKHTAILKQFKTQLITQGYLGDFREDYSTRLVNATDNSIYEVMPLAVAQPKTFDDLHTLITISNYPQFSSISLTARGGGTGTNGQSLANGIIIDFSLYMNKIIDFNPELQTITVEPGLILSDLNRFLQPHGLFFAPDVSTANRATIGGMIATDAAGRGSLIYGKTIDSILSLKVILADGYVIDTESVDVAGLASDEHAQIAQGETGNKDRIRHIHASLIAWLTPLQEEIDKRFIPLKRPLSGYNIKRCIHAGKIDLTALFTGSEGTLGLIACAKLKLLPIPKYKTLVVVHYNSFIAALRDAKNLIKYYPVAIEAVDEKVQKSAQTLANWPTLAKWLNVGDNNYISNFVEFVANDKQELSATIALLEAQLLQQGANYVVIRDSEQIKSLWSIRSLAVGLAGKIPGRGKPVAFIEDAIVPPESLADFVSDLQQLLEQENLQYAMYGHVDVGCIHVRPALDLQQESDRQKIRPITQQVIKLLSKYNGILWGEHGKGFRGEFVAEVFGPILYPVLCQIKQLFDPQNRLNPGKLTAPTPSIKLARIEQVPMRGEFDQVISQTNQQNFAGSILCNGNGACFNQEPSNVMCPSYKVTKDRIHSPKGRAMLVKQWLRATANPTSDDHTEIAKMALVALNGCLGCKACASQCPTQVSIPDLRSAFLDKYHRQYKKRHPRDFILGYIEDLLPLVAKFPRTWNFAHKFSLLPTLGLKNIPLFKSAGSLKKQLKALNVELYTTAEQIKFMPHLSVVVFADVFTGLLDTQVLIATVLALKNMGYTTYVIYPRSSGKALIVGGFMARFKSRTQQIGLLLEPLFAANIPVLGLENTVTLMFRDEVKKFATEFSGQVYTLAEFLNQNVQQLRILRNSRTNNQKLPAEYKLLPHCTEQAVLPGEALLWKNIFSQLGIKLEVQNAGCCGMAGAYGYMACNLENSKKLFAMHWQQPVNSDTEILATGFSCRCQTERLAQKVIVHPIQIIYKHLSV